MQRYSNLLIKTEISKSHSKLGKGKTTIILLCLALFTRIVLIFATGNPFLVEKLYSSTIYLYIAKAIGFISSFIPFSIAEFLLISAMPITAIIFILIIVKPQYIFSNIIRIFNYIVRILSTAYILFYLLWGLNYYRQDYFVLANMQNEVASYNELFELTSHIIIKSNTIREFVPENDDGVFYIEESFSSLGKIANEGFNNYNIGKINLSGNYGRIKPIFLSKYMSYTGIMGIFIPFTSEPTINLHIPDISLPSTISHEIAHQRGFAKEEEANFIAYKANINNPDLRFQYSGYYLAMNYLLNEIYKLNQDDYSLLFNKITTPIKRDMIFEANYWASKEGRVKKTVTTMNDNYLKANNQEDGVRSYSGIVKLLLAEYKSEKSKY